MATRRMTQIKDRALGAERLCVPDRAEDGMDELAGLFASESVVEVVREALI